MKSPMTVLSTFVSAAVVSTMLAAPTHAAPTTNTSTTSSTASESSLTAAQKAKKKQAKAAAKKKRLIAKRKKVRVVTAKAFKIAKRKKGARYSYGSNGPYAFDCSGLTSWAYKKAGKKLPRTSAAQAKATKRIKKPRKGDLVFFHRGGRVYHVGLYAGKGRIFHASRAGKPVKTEKIWTRSIFYGRIKAA